MAKGKPSKGTPKDKRLKSTKAKKSTGNKTKKGTFKLFTKSK